ncbi:MAG TPA: hypothetical protein VFX22_08440, partial [Candidatus Kapabacteria bacterium]|nr:hypothetical protein [Candidatus Kapabacteria bacterium]
MSDRQPWTSNLPGLPSASAKVHILKRVGRFSEVYTNEQSFENEQSFAGQRDTDYSPLKEQTMLL